MHKVISFQATPPSTGACRNNTACARTGCTRYLLNLNSYKLCTKILMEKIYIYDDNKTIQFEFFPTTPVKLAAEIQTLGSQTNRQVSSEVCTLSDWELLFSVGAIASLAHQL